jgi:hypothetical protein
MLEKYLIIVIIIKVRILINTFKNIIKTRIF